MNTLALFAVAASFAFDVAPWEDTALGTEDTVPPPWTLPVAAETQYSCWGRTYSFGGGGLVSSVKSQAKELLADPVSNAEANGAHGAVADKFLAQSFPADEIANTVDHKGG
jgi:hypothetical protein